jgi:transglutaminase-like putative cysteine protease
MKLEISHITRYTYPNSVQSSVNEIRLTPRTNFRQACYHHAISTEPISSMFMYEDFFRNRVHSFTVNKPHNEMVITMVSTVVTHDNDNIQKNKLNPEDERTILDSDSFQNQLAEYLLRQAIPSLHPGSRLIPINFLIMESKSAIY